MKKMILSISFLILFSTLTFSQVGNHFKLDTTIRNLNLGVYRIEKFNDSLKGYNLLTPKFSTKNQMVRKSSDNEKTKSYGEMPCVIPEGYFPMRTVSPDSSKKYSLIIKQL